MDKNEVYQKICKMINEEINLEEELKLTENIRLIEDLGFDSVQLISLIAKIEDEFQIEFVGNEMLFDNFNFLGDLCNMVIKIIRG